MKTEKLIAAAAVSSLFMLSSAFAFEGRIAATVTRGGQGADLLYTVGKNQLRIEQTATNRPHARNIVDLQTGVITLVFPHNRTFLRLPPASGSAAARPGAPTLPPGIGPQSGVPAGAPAMSNLPAISATPVVIGPTNLSALPAPPAMPAMPRPAAGLPPGVGPQPGGPSGLPAMPMMPMMPMDVMEKAEFKATGQKTNLLGYACARYELTQRGEVLEVWATAELLPFQPWLASQSPRFGPRMIEEQWGELLRQQKLFPLRAILKFEHGPERLRFTVNAITPDKIEDRDGALFEPPRDYHEIEPLPF